MGQAQVSVGNKFKKTFKSRLLSNLLWWTSRDSVISLLLDDFFIVPRRKFIVWLCDKIQKVKVYLFFFGGYSYKVLIVQKICFLSGFVPYVFRWKFHWSNLNGGCVSTQNRRPPPNQLLVQVQMIQEVFFLTFFHMVKFALNFVWFSSANNKEILMEKEAIQILIKIF